jgi:hypothetical protein
MNRNDCERPSHSGSRSFTETCLTVTNGNKTKWHFLLWKLRIFCGAGGRPSHSQAAERTMQLRRRRPGASEARYWFEAAPAPVRDQGGRGSETMARGSDGALRDHPIIGKASLQVNEKCRSPLPRCATTFRDETAHTCHAERGKAKRPDITAAGNQRLDQLAIPLSSSQKTNADGVFPSSSIPQWAQYKPCAYFCTCGTGRKLARRGNWNGCERRNRRVERNIGVRAQPALGRREDSVAVLSRGLDNWRLPE